MATKVPPTTKFDEIEDVEEVGPMTGAASLSQVLQGVKPETMGDLYQSRGTSPADRMGAAVKLQRIVGEINDLAGRHGLSGEQHFGLLRGLGTPMESPPESMEEEAFEETQAFDVPVDGGDVMQERAAAAMRMRDNTDV
jgi:hypothetical protein